MGWAGGHTAWAGAGPLLELAALGPRATRRPPSFSILPGGLHSLAAVAPVPDGPLLSPGAYVHRHL